LPSFTDSKLLEVQKILASLKLEVGRPDGAWGSRTEKALTYFLNHRNMDFDGEFSQNEYLEVVEQAKYIAPEASRLKLCKKGRFPRKNSFERSSEDTSKFTVRIQSGDYDGADYTSKEARNSVFSSAKFINFIKQRAELRNCRNIAYGKTYALDFDVKVSHFSAD